LSSRATATQAMRAVIRFHEREWTFAVITTLLPQHWDIHPIERAPREPGQPDKTGFPVVSVGVTTPQHRAELFLDPASDPREAGPRLGDERTTLNEFLRVQRLTLEIKCDGLDAAQLARRAVEPSTMSLLGLVRHMAEVERAWFRRRFAGQDMPKRYQTEADPDADFNGAVADPAVVDEAWAAWRDEIAFADEFTREHDLDFVGRDSEEGPVSLRELLMHMIEEYARHNGHADLLRERIDGRIGQ
jgi:uncharacterized damage-inducible protein DinB